MELLTFTVMALVVASAAHSVLIARLISSQRRIKVSFEVVGRKASEEGEEK